MQQLQVDFRELEEGIRSALPSVQAIRPRLGASIKCDDLAIVVSALGYGLTLRWYRPANSLGDACLYVTLWNRPVAGVEPLPHQPRKLLESRFSYDLADTGRAMFFANGRDLACTAKEIAAVCLQYVVDRARRDPLRWFRW